MKEEGVFHIHVDRIFTRLVCVNMKLSLSKGSDDCIIIN